MIIGNDFNTKAKELLKLLAAMSGGSEEEKVAVIPLVNELKLDRTEVKNLMEYLENKEYLSVVSIGGPYLYGHIRITGKGLYKASRISD